MEVIATYKGAEELASTLNKVVTSTHNLPDRLRESALTQIQHMAKGVVPRFFNKLFHTTLRELYR